MKINNAIMITVSSRNWSWPKDVLISMGAPNGRMIKDIAKDALEKYKEISEEKDLVLLSYCYHGNVEVVEQEGAYRTLPLFFSLYKLNNYYII